MKSNFDLCVGFEPALKISSENNFDLWDSNSSQQIYGKKLANMTFPVEIRENPKEK